MIDLEVASGLRRLTSAGQLPERRSSVMLLTVEERLARASGPLCAIEVLRSS